MVFEKKGVFGPSISLAARPSVRADRRPASGATAQVCFVSCVLLFLLRGDIGASLLFAATKEAAGGPGRKFFEKPSDRSPLARERTSLSTFAGERGSSACSRGVGYHRFAPPWRRLAPNRAKRARDRREIISVNSKNFSLSSRTLLGGLHARLRRGVRTIVSLFSQFQFQFCVLTVADCCATLRGERTTEQDLRNVNDPSAGSPTETLLRLLLPLNDQVWSSSRQHRQCRDIAAHQSEDLTKSFNR